MQFFRQLLLTLVERAGFLVEEDVNNMMTDMSKEVAVTHIVCRKRTWLYVKGGGNGVSCLFVVWWIKIQVLQNRRSFC